MASEGKTADREEGDAMSEESNGKTETKKINPRTQWTNVLGMHLDVCYIKSKFSF